MARAGGRAARAGQTGVRSQGPTEPGQEAGEVPCPLACEHPLKGSGMTLVSDLELPAFDYTDATIRGEQFHRAMAELRAQGWLAEGPFGYITLDREAGEFFLRTRSAIFPGMKIAEIFEVTEGPLYEQMRRNILHVNGPDHTRLRSLVNPSLSPRAVERYRPVMRGFLEDLLADARASPDGNGDGDGGVRCEFVEAFAKPYPSQTIASVMGAPVSD